MLTYVNYMLTISSIATVAVGLHYMQQTILTENCMRARSYMKNQISTKFSTRCQNANAVIATNLLYSKYLCKFDQQLKRHIFCK